MRTGDFLFFHEWQTQYGHSVNAAPGIILSKVHHFSYVSGNNGLILPEPQYGQARRSLKDKLKVLK